MKKNTKKVKVMIAMSIIITALNYSACKKEETPAPVAPVTPVPTDHVTAKINGVDFINDTPTGMLANNTILQISGTTGNYYLAVQLNDYANIGVGTYTFPSAGTGFCWLQNAPNTHYQTGTGSVTFTTCDKTNKVFAGAFNFKATNAGAIDTMKITNGSFYFDFP